MTDNSGVFNSFFYSSRDGLRLHARLYGQPKRNQLPIVCLPGLSRSGADFHRFARFAASKEGGSYFVIAFDYRGRGKSDWDNHWQNYNLITEAEDILAGLTALNLEHGHFIGTSRGGLILHMLAASRPAALKTVVLNDIGPEIGGAGLAQIRAYLKRNRNCHDWPSAVAKLKAEHGKAFPVLKDTDWQAFAEAVYAERDGTLIADYDPALLNTLTSIDFNQPLPTLWPQFAGLASIPMMVIRGEHSQLLLQNTVDEMAKRHPKMIQIVADGQGHAPLLEIGDLSTQIIHFIRQL